MNEHDSTELIDENELRSALRPLQPDRDEFADTVRKKIEASSISLSSEPNEKRNQSDWMRVAASIIPLPIFGSGEAIGMVGSLAKVSTGKKLVAFAALPAIGVFLMIGGTIMAMFRIKRINQNSNESPFTAKQLHEACAWWWKRYGWLPAALGFGGLLLKLGLGISVPILPVFLVSGLAMVAFVTYLGKQGCVSRQAIGGSFLQVLMALGQVTGIFVFGADVHLLDPELVKFVLFTGGLLLMAILAFGFRNKDRDLYVWVMLPGLIVMLAFCGWLGRSLWQPSAETYLKARVENFDQAPSGNYDWKIWEEPALVLMQSGVDVDLLKPQRLLDKELLKQPEDGYQWILRTAMVTGLLKNHDLTKLYDLGKAKAMLIKPPDNFLRNDDAGQAVGALAYYDFAIRALHATEQLDAVEHAFLVERLKANITYIISADFGRLLELQHAVDLLEFVAGRESCEPFRAAVLKFVVEQKRDSAWTMTAHIGGFADYRSSKSGDLFATIAALRLMERYGVPDGIDTISLRSFLRTTSTDRRFWGIGGQRAAGQILLNRLDGIPDVTWWDYLRLEQALIMAVLLVILAIYATLAAPNTEPEPAELER